MFKTLAALLIAGACGAAHSAASSDHAGAACLNPAKWYALDGAKPRAIPEAELISDMARREVVLLGEQHDDADHHWWQLQTLAALHAVKPDMVIGFEAFPRRVQPELDRWSAGALGTSEFLKRVEWDKVWGFPPELYLPLLHFARINRIPVVALNVERSLTEAVGAKGWDAVPPQQREGLTRPAAPPAAYEASLFEIYKEHARGRATGAPASIKDPAFRNFVEAQTTWDRAMAEALASRTKGAGAARPLAVGIMGAGHVRGGHGVVHQLRDLGVTRIGSLLAVPADTDCSALVAPLADAVFALPAARDETPPPRLGVRLELRNGEVVIAAIDPGSLAARSGLQAGDVVLSAAGAPASSASSVSSAVRNTLPGTWLPLQIRRGSTTTDIIVKFPPKP
ncbi:MAG: hypothetical protein JWM26_1970 [Betaproteobacteria bacterium]|nr:hypothetical protein [Betaproteobacteria bacterium]